MDRLGTWTELNFWSPSSRMDARVNGETKMNMEVVKRSAEHIDGIHSCPFQQPHSSASASSTGEWEQRQHNSHDDSDISPLRFFRLRIPTLPALVQLLRDNEGTCTTLATGRS